MWPPRKAAIKKARVSRGKYRCASCLGKHFGPKDIQLDHIEPVIDPHKGFTTWDDFIERLFCDETGWAVKCKPCHEYKTHAENIIRSLVKEEKDEDNNDDL